MDWPIDTDDFEDLTFDYEAGELGIDAKTAAKVVQIKQLRPLVTNQPWGIFFVKFEPKRLPVVALRRLLNGLVIKKRSSRSSEQAAWNLHDLLFISNYGEDEERHITFAHFSEDSGAGDLPTLKVLGWDGDDTNLHIDDVAKTLTTKLCWPDDVDDTKAWNDTWASAFTLHHREVITTSKRMAERLAELARSIRNKATAALAIESEHGPLRKLMKAFQQSLVHDLNESDFADMYAQTIAYGLLSARVSRPEGLVADNMADLVPVTNPFLKELLETFLRLGGRRRTGHRNTGIDFDELGINEVVQMLRLANMEAVVRDFGDKNPQEDPVIHFYELFLKEYDAKKRMQRGVFYTPRPVVSYIVRSVHELLQTEFGLEDGLADTATWGEMAERHKDLTIPDGVKPADRFVTILDPATGTGTFLVECIDVIYRTLVEKWKRTGCRDAAITDLWNDYVSKHLLPRLHGYELLMAPYAIAHLKIGLKLHETGYRFGSDERARIYLTNALEPASDTGQQMLVGMFPALAHEAQAVNEIKRNQRFTVVIGNPPYNTMSKNMGEWIKQLVGIFRIVEGSMIIEKGKRNHLQDDYVKFIRFGLYQLENSGLGICGMITNHGFLYSPTFRGMRYYIHENVSGARFLDLNGNIKRNDAKQHPGDENVFDIQQGVAISFLWKTQYKRDATKLAHATIYGSRDEKSRLLLSMPYDIQFCRFQPQPDFYIFHAETQESETDEYNHWPKLDEIMPFGGTGLKSNRDDFVIDFDDAPVLDRMNVFRDEKVSDADVQRMLGLKENYTWKISKIRRLFRGDTNHDRMRDIEYRLFDRRRIYYQKNVVYNPRFETMAQARCNNIYLLSCRQQFETGFRHAFVTRQMFECCLVSAKSREMTYGFPLYVDSCKVGEGTLFLDNKHVINYSGELHELLKRKLGFVIVDNVSVKQDTEISGSDVFNYFYSILFSPGYRKRYEEKLKLEFPRLPITTKIELFHKLARLGGELVGLHLMESPKLDDFITTYIGSKDPEVLRVNWSDDTVWLNAAATKKGQSSTPGTVGFRGVPEDVWNFHIGGYQVCEKWLKDRKGRTLSEEDIIHYQKIVVALHETIRIMGEIDEVIESHGGWPGAFQGAGE
ncbi:type ISP restriction/modification enzyme [uncultured Desulfobulbus sp.]|uniref:type ISP restriction/modification enzyme n=1 Tax=uncultured Desulfobulbus sp. TaxID=239745 RepID=UPI0029C72D41|nr:type ISP restriction/modification enzyme [uncultured Desulfobulbus sp.]